MINLRPALPRGKGDTRSYAIRARPPIETYLHDRGGWRPFVVRLGTSRQSATHSFWSACIKRHPIVIIISIAATPQCIVLRPKNPRRHMYHRVHPRPNMVRPDGVPGGGFFHPATIDDPEGNHVGNVGFSSSPGRDKTKFDNPRFDHLRPNFHRTRGKRIATCTSIITVTIVVILVFTCRQVRRRKTNSPLSDPIPPMSSVSNSLNIPFWLFSPTATLVLPHVSLFFIHSTQ